MKPANSNKKEECPLFIEEETRDAMAISKEVMTTVVELDVPLEVKFE